MTSPSVTVSAVCLMFCMLFAAIVALYATSFGLEAIPAGCCVDVTWSVMTPMRCWT